MNINLGRKQRSGTAFKLPLAVVTMTLAILARKGRGKSYTAAVLAEELLDAGQVPVIIDPTGAHWGLKALADGKTEGYPVVIFGGDHADLPLEEHAGEIVARSIVEQRFPAIIDLSHFKKGQTYRFLAVFLETMFRLNREPLHIVADEADYYAPQQPHGEQARVLGAMEDIVRRGRIRGIGCTMVTQRPQVLAKNVLTQADMLVALGMNHPRDIGAIEEWVQVHGDTDKASLMIASLPSLPIGTAWFWAPALDDTFEIVEIRARKTFDSSATPKPGERVVAPKKLAQIDVAKLGAEITASIERSKESDPVELKKRIAELTKQLAAKPAAGPAPAPTEVKVPDRENLTRLTDRLDELKSSLLEILPVVTTQVERLTKLDTEIGMVGAVITRELSYIGTGKKTLPPVERFLGILAPKSRSNPNGVPQETAQRSNGHTPGAVEIGSGGKRRILSALAQYSDGMGTRRLSLLTGISASGGTWRTYLGELRSGGYVEGGGDHMRITDAGARALGHYEPLPTGERLREYWRQRLGDSGKRRIFDAVVAAHPQAISYDEVSRATGIATDGGTWRTYLGELRGLELIEGRGELRASDDLFTP